jgi:hypothetical protein
MMSDTSLTTEVGMLVSIERYNRLSEIEKAEEKFPAGVSITVVNMNTRIGMILPTETTVQRVAMALIHLVGEAGVSYRVDTIRDKKGVLLENRAQLGELWDKAPFEPIFIGLSVTGGE